MRGEDPKSKGMTVSQLIAELQKMPQEADVCIRDEQLGSDEWMGYDEAKEIEAVYGPKDSGNYWRKGAVVIK